MGTWISPLVARPPACLLQDEAKGPGLQPLRNSSRILTSLLRVGGLNPQGPSGTCTPSEQRPRVLISYFAPQQQARQPPTRLEDIHRVFTGAGACRAKRGEAKVEKGREGGSIRAATIGSHVFTHPKHFHLLQGQLFQVALFLRQHNHLLHCALVWRKKTQTSSFRSYGGHFTPVLQRAELVACGQYLGTTSKVLVFTFKTLH